MDCPKGSVCKEREHRVLTLGKAVEWFPGAGYENLPITVNQTEASNGRMMIKIFDKDRALIHQRG